LFIERKVDLRREVENRLDLGFMGELDRKYQALAWIIRQDGTNCHISQKAVDGMEENCDLPSDQTTNSPNICLIEFLWEISKYRVSHPRCSIEGHDGMRVTPSRQLQETMIV
jgi:hypothetical protein